ncbi:MAG TPA: biotin carboxylase N-terminal domain-containing protein [Nocardioides sp.]|uniref:ATP-binding protein n=1 Tax=Nocardioides sp. TaxID=35761 RepID=UPI002B6B8868|nr:biotin carboxylase N-terminal domain-containing protein [Nocardioides sp.]HTW16038.1 biotin carboxylase N-terminal domain-containing protein [Nocardioides sp.]
MIQRLMVANRAEIASRVFRTCRRLGIETVAVHSDADAGLPYVVEADLAVRLPGDAPADTYLRADLLVEAALRAGADAVHPGYGFLSENADFARAVQAAGLTWVGPQPEAIEAMGSKIEAKRLMEAAGVPVLRNLDAESATEADLPLIVKASAGGGGRGMRIVRDLASLAGEIETARDEARSAFGDGTVFVETYVERGRHVEVQVWGDAEGRIAVLGERDCSLQRRHQKVVEEAPAPGLPDPVREALHSAARAAAEAISYQGAGTVEFLYDEEAERFFFLEMNTRLQVEHPVTELVFHQDLVELQLRTAQGETSEVRFPAKPDRHAVEVRLYAEDPARDYQPQSGVLTRFEIPTTPYVRVDTGYASGSTVGTHYDAMLAKVIAWGRTREAAIRSLADTLRRARIHGVTTNRDQLLAILRDEQFRAGRVSTAFLGGFETGLRPSSTTGAGVAAALALAELAVASRSVQRGIPVAFRNVPSQPQRTVFESGTVEWWGGRDGYRVDGYDVVSVATDRVVLEQDGLRTSYDVAAVGDRVDVDWAGGHAALQRVPRFTDPADAVASGSLLAPMPGTVVSVAVAAGDEVEAGRPVLVLEAMKMQHTVSAPYPGTVTVLNVKAGSQVAAGEVLAVVEETA